MAAALARLKQWFHKRRQLRPPAALGPPPALLERYLQYKRLLAANSAILTTVADLQVKMDEGFLFDMHYVRQACVRLGQEVTAMVAALNGMSGGHYGLLEAARERVAQAMAAELGGADMRPVPLVLPLAQVGEGQFWGQGGKAGGTHPLGPGGARGLCGERLCPEALL